MKLAVVGAFGGTHVGGSFSRAADHLGIEVTRLDVANAEGKNRLLRTLYWRLADRRVPDIRRFSADVVATCARIRSDVLITTGKAALTRPALRALSALGTATINYSTDDPWNPALSARWHLRNLPEYDFIFTTRCSNISDFRRLGCANIYYLPFGYDDELFGRSLQCAEAPIHDILFVGTADRDRAAFVADFVRSGLQVALVGGYWQRYAPSGLSVLGTKPPEVVRALTAAAKINLCLVRRANRDGHVMRSFEIAAVGGCMLVEDTEEHRRIFGPNGESVIYFVTPEEAAARAKELLADPARRAQLSAAVQSRITDGANTYRDRLAAMLKVLAETQVRTVSS